MREVGIDNGGPAMQWASLHVVVDFLALEQLLAPSVLFHDIVPQRQAGCNLLFVSRAKSEEGTVPKRIIFVLGAEQGVHVSANLAGWVVSGQKS